MAIRKKHYWLHRISYYYEIAKPMLDMGYLTYGFSDFAVIDNYLETATSRHEIEKIMTRKWKSLSRNKNQLIRFILEMKSGDYVVVPIPNGFTVCEILEDKAITIGDIKESIKDINGIEQKRNSKNFILRDKDGASEEIKDLGFARRVKIICKDIHRNKYADAALVSRMKARQTNLNISDLEKSIISAIDLKNNNQQISLRREIADAADIIKLKILSKLDDRKFECLIKWYFQRIGASNVYIPSKNNRETKGLADVDIIATFESLRTIYYVQAKHHADITDDHAVQQIEGVKKIKENDRMADGFNRIYWVLSSADDFTDKCKNLAQISEIQLINGREFSDMLLDVGLCDVDKAL